MRGRLIDLTIGMNRKQRVTLEIDGDFRDKYDRLKGTDLDVEIKKHREKRSNSANAYFHVLVGKIAAEIGGGEDEEKTRLVLEYGTPDIDADGFPVGVKLPVSADITEYYPYAKCFDTREENGRLFNCYILYKPTHRMDTKEMARLIDGAIETAKELGIETDTPEQIERFKAAWEQAERSRKNE